MKLKRFDNFKLVTENTDGAHKISAEEALENAGYEDITELLHESIIPACCSYGCEVEPDGTCEHGYPSVFLEMGLI
jgi:hypothetical protein